MAKKANRNYGMTDEMHGFIGIMMLSSFMSGFLHMTELISIYLSILTGVLFSAIASFSAMYFLSTVSELRILGVEHLFEGRTVKKRNFITIEESSLVFLLFISCLLFGYYIEDYIRVTYYNLIQFIMFIPISVIFVIVISLTNYRLGEVIYKNDFNGIHFINKQKELRKTEKRN